MNNLSFSELGKKSLVLSEGLRYVAYDDYDGKPLSEKNYKCIGNPSTGIGHLIRIPKEEYLLKAYLTIDQAYKILDEDISIIETWLNKNCKWGMKQWQFDSLCNLIHQYHAIMYDKYPATKAAIINGDIDAILFNMKQFRNSVAGNGDNKLLPRREREVAMFLGNYPVTI